MNFSSLSPDSTLGRLARLPLKLIPRGMVVPILQGRLRGKKWVAGCSNHGYWLGSYELNKRRLFEQVVKPGQVVYDLGGNVGYFTLLASVLVGEGGRVAVFEPLPRNLGYIRRHLALNRATNVTVMAAAVCEREGTAFFEEGFNDATGHLSTRGVEVRTVALDELVAQGELPEPDVIKMDVEGAELAALAGARGLLERRHPVLFLDTHGDANRAGVLALLAELGYRVQPLGADSPDATYEFVATWG